MNGVDTISLATKPSLELQRLDGRMQKRQRQSVALLSHRRLTLTPHQPSHDPQTCEPHLGTCILKGHALAQAGPFLGGSLGTHVGTYRVGRQGNKVLRNS